MRSKVLIILLMLSQCCFAQHWDSLYGGLNRNVTCLYADTVSNKLYVGGIFTTVNRDTTWGMASWSNNQWDSLEHGIDRYTMGPNMPGSTWAMARYGNYLYTGGNFRRAGNVNTGAFARWDGISWDSVPGGQLSQYGTISDLIVHNNELYICGGFDSVGSLPLNNIAKWDGTTWQSIGNNYAWSGLLTKMIFFNGSLYVAGTFDDQSGNFCRLAKWNGQNWHFFTTDIQGGIADIWDMEVFNNELYISGLFYASAGCAGNSIMRWNDTIWRDVGGSVEIGGINPFPTIKDMCIHNGKLYCGGNFEKVGGVQAGYLACWNGIDWCGYNTTLNFGVEKIAFYNDTLYAGGGFIELDNDTAYYIAQWIGGNVPDTCGNTTGITDIPNKEILISIFPNPASGSTTVKINGAFSKGSLCLFDQLGRPVLIQAINTPVSEIDLNGLAAGIYFYRLEQNGEVRNTGKIVVSD